jgi:hypothetical protein
MRRTFATLLISALLISSAPSFARRDDDPSGPLRLIKKIIRLLIPSPTDDGGTIAPPKP